MPTVNITRKSFSDKSTIGSLTITSTSFVCDTLEPPQASGQLTPAGEYDAEINYSIDHGHLVVRILGYDDDNREVHSGNKWNPPPAKSDTTGCTLVGEYTPSMPDWISNSKYTYSLYWDALMDALKQEAMQLRVVIK